MAEYSAWKRQQLRDLIANELLRHKEELKRIRDTRRAALAATAAELQAHRLQCARELAEVRATAKRRVERIRAVRDARIRQLLERSEMRRRALKERRRVEAAAGDARRAEIAEHRRRVKKASKERRTTPRQRAVARAELAYRNRNDVVSADPSLAAAWDSAHGRAFRFQEEGARRFQDWAEEHPEAVLALREEQAERALKADVRERGRAERERAKEERAERRAARLRDVPF